MISPIIKCPCPVCLGCTCPTKRNCVNGLEEWTTTIHSSEEILCYCTPEENNMPYAMYTKDGEPSFNGIDPKLKRYCGYLFGWHKKNTTCLKCNNYTHYSLHRKYKFTANIERVSSIDRIWCCSEECFKSIILEQLFNFTIPPEEAHKILGLTE